MKQHVQPEQYIVKVNQIDVYLHTSRCDILYNIFLFLTRANEPQKPHCRRCQRKKFDRKIR